MTPLRTAALLVLALLLAVSTATAHALGVSTGGYVPHGSSVVGTLTFARGELAALVPALDANRDGHVSALEVREARPRLAERVLARVIVTRGGEACPSVIVDAGLADEDGVVVRGRWDCAVGDAPFVIDLALLDDLAPGHRHVVGDEVLAGDVRRLSLARIAEPAVAAARVEAAPSPGAWAFFTMGVEHILSGADHLVFLLGLLVVVEATTRSMRSALAVVTAFTVGHSFSLAVAMLGLWLPSSRLVEPAIALSIVYVGIENFFVQGLRGRWRIALPFGLVHGFGLAGALQAVAAPRPAVALASFNLGVEAGQLGVLAVLLPLLLGLRRRRWFVAHGMRLVSGAVAVAGVAWFVARVA